MAVMIGLATQVAPATASVAGPAQDDTTTTIDEGSTAAEPEVYQDTDAELSVTEGSLEDDDGPSIAAIAGAFIVLGAAVALGFYLVVNRRPS